MASETYTVVVADHFHYQDPDEQWTAGKYASASDALARAQGIVAACISDLAREGARGDVLLRLYLTQGDDPFIVGSPAVQWSALEYAREFIERIGETADPGEALF